MTKNQIIFLALYCSIASFIFVGLFQDYPSCIANTLYVPWVFGASAISWYAGQENFGRSAASVDDIDQSGILIGFIGFWVAGLTGLMLAFFPVAIGWWIAHLFFDHFTSQMFGANNYLVCSRQP